MSGARSSRSSSEASSHYGRDRAYSTRSKQSLANVSVRSFSDFRAQTSSIPNHSPQSLKRKPLPHNASPQVSCFSPSRSHFGHVDDLVIPLSIVDGKSKQAPDLTTAAGPVARKEDFVKSVHATAQEYLEQRESAYTSDGLHETAPSDHRLHKRLSLSSRTTLQERDLPPRSRQRLHDNPSDSPISPTRQPRLPKDAHSGHDDRPLLRLIVEPPTFHGPQVSLTTPLSEPDTPTMSVFPDAMPGSESDHTSTSGQSTSPTKKLNANSASKFSSFFGWKSSPKTGPDSPTTPFTDRSGSPSESPYFPDSSDLHRSISGARLNTPAHIDVQTANSMHSLVNGSPGAATVNRILPNNTHLDDLERELREVSAELACSIKREMDLEDEVDRYKADPLAAPPTLSRRTSDYFSDSGSSNHKGASSEADYKMEELEKAKRKVEQQKGQIRADYSTKLAEELRLRHNLELHIGQLEQEHREAQARAVAGAQSVEKIRELETFLDESRRRLTQERQSRDNFEDLLAALRGELTQMRAERDNLTEEVVPQLRARVEGLEHENTRMQQEFAYPTANRSRVNSVAEDAMDTPSTPWSKMGGLVRSNSVFNNVQGSGLRRGNSTLNRANSVKGRGQDHAEVKEVEDQRDALHKTLKNLISRHDAQKREHARAVQRLIVDREAAALTTPARSTFVRDVTNLKEEIVALRRRTDEVLTQKWQCEDNLGGVKMALDRAEQETRSLRAMLGCRQENNRRVSNGLGIDLRNTRQEDDGTSLVKILRRSIQLAETERDAARREAEVYRAKASGAPNSKLSHDLLESADRLDALAASLHECVENNIHLRERLVVALELGESEQSNSAAKVVEMQSRLKVLEESLLSAQQESENTFAQNEEVAKAMDENTRPQMSRLTLSVPGPQFMGPKAGENFFSARSSRAGAARTGKAKSLCEATKTAALGNKVADLERALVAADGEMKVVVQRVEQSRGEIAALRGERDSANQNMKMLQDAISQEKQRALRLLA